LKLVTITSAVRPFFGGAPRKSHKFMCTYSEPAGGTLPRDVQVEGTPDELVNVTAFCRQSNDWIEEATAGCLNLFRFQR
jgi:hypothetical protein